MLHYFGGDLNDLVYLGTNRYAGKSILTMSRVLEEDLKKIEEWYHISIVDGELTLTDNDNIELNKKRSECREKIEEWYKEHDQINILRSWIQDDIDVMNSWIDPILDEYRTNGVDADFSQFVWG